MDLKGHWRLRDLLRHGDIFYQERKLFIKAKWFNKPLEGKISQHQNTVSTWIGACDSMITLVNFLYRYRNTTKILKKKVLWKITTKQEPEQRHARTRVRKHAQRTRRGRDVRVKPSGSQISVKPHLVARTTANFSSQNRRRYTSGGIWRTASDMTTTSCHYHIREKTL